MPPIAAQVSFLRALKGAPASILIALLLTGRAHTQRELQLTTGYSDKPVSEGLALLEMAGVVRREESGWRLTVRPEAINDLFSAGESPPPTTRNISDSPSTTAPEISSSKDNDSVVASTYPDRPETENPTIPVDNSPEPVENMFENKEQPRGNHLPLRSPVSGPRSESTNPPSADQRPPSNNTIRAWLEREYRLRWKLDKPEEYRVGLLIRRLEDGDPAPPLRCPICLDELPCRYSH